MEYTKHTMDQTMMDEIQDGATDYWINYNYDNYTNGYEWLGQEDDGRWVNGEWINEFNDVENGDFSKSHLDNK